MRQMRGQGSRRRSIHEAKRRAGWHAQRALGKRFNQTYRERCGVDDRPEGRQKSRVNFHSFRGVVHQESG